MAAAAPGSILLCLVAPVFMSDTSLREDWCKCRDTCKPCRAACTCTAALPFTVALPFCTSTQSMYTHPAMCPVVFSHIHVLTATLCSSSHACSKQHRVEGRVNLQTPCMQHAAATHNLALLSPNAQAGAAERLLIAACACQQSIQRPSKTLWQQGVGMFGWAVSFRPSRHAYASVSVAGTDSAETNAAS